MKLFENGVVPGRRPRGSPGALGTAGSFRAPVGARIEPGTVRGYYIDFRAKAPEPRWPPPWFKPGGVQLYVATAQWGLGCWEHYALGEGEAWLGAALAAARRLVDSQERSGPRAGGWVHRFRYAHTFPLAPPWLSGMAQGEAASLLVRLHAELGEERLGEAALRALEPMRTPSSAGGVATELDGRFFPEEYPTDPPSRVLNGGIFGLWGCYDVAVALGDSGARDLFDEGTAGLAAGLDRYDTGSWSRYDLFPHPLVNLASPVYHRLHANQLRAMATICPRAEFSAAAARFEGYAESRTNVARAIASKVAFRLAVPRNRLLAGRMPWDRAARPPAPTSVQ